MGYSFTLFTLEFTSSNTESLHEAPRRFASNAEIVYFDKKSGKLKMQFVSTASLEQVLFICDEFKKEVELSGGDRLTYRVVITKF